MSRQKLLHFRTTKEDSFVDDRDLVIRARDGDRGAFEKLVERYRNQVYWTSYNLVLDSEDARDIAQQVFIRIWKSLPQYDTARPLISWITKIAANCSIDFLRSRKRTEEVVDVPADAVKFDQNLDIRKIFATVVPLLTERQRVVLVLREIDDLSFTEIAEVLDCTESTVRNLLSQAKDSFRKKVKELFPSYGMQ